MSVMSMSDVALGGTVVINDNKSNGITASDRA